MADKPKIELELNPRGIPKAPFVVSSVPSDSRGERELLAAASSWRSCRELLGRT